MSVLRCAIRRTSPTWPFLALAFVAAACSGEPTGLGNPSGSSESLGQPSGSSQENDGGTAGGPAGSGESSQPTGSGESDGSNQGSGPEEPIEPSGETSVGHAVVTFAQSGSTLANVLLADMAVQVEAAMASAQLAGASPDQVESIEFSLTGVQLHRLGAPEQDGDTGGAADGGADGGTDGGMDGGTDAGTDAAGDAGGVPGASWVTVELAEGTTLVIDLTELPAEGLEAEANGSGLEIAAGEIPAGTYRNVRLLGEATITFNETLSAGNAEFIAGEPYPLEIPSSESSGVKVQTPKFEIMDGGTAAIMLVFDGAESIKKIKLKPSGASMVPVMTADVQADVAEAPEAPAP